MPKGTRRAAVPPWGSDAKELHGLESSAPNLDPRMHHALTDLHAYVLVLDAEWRRLGERAAELDRTEAAGQQRTELERRRTEITEELEALRATIAALRERADPEGGTL